MNVGRMLGVWMGFATPFAVAQEAEAGEAPQRAALGHTLEVSAGGGNTDAPLGGLAYWLQAERVRFGIQTQVGWGRGVYLQGHASDGVLRWRARLPVAFDLVGNRRARLAIFTAPGLRYLNGDGRRALAVALDSGLSATVYPVDAVAISAGVGLPFALDVSPSVEVARFPGLTVGAGAYWRFRPRLSIGINGTVSFPEGYGGDSEKYIVEGWLGFRVHFGQRDRATDHLPILNAAI